MLFKPVLEFEYEPKENPDWDYARNPHAILRNSRIEFAQAVFSCKLREYIVPNRDYSYEGLCAIIDNQNWKFLDALGVKTSFPLIPKKIIVTPWSAVYTYSSNSEQKLKIDYSLLENGLKIIFQSDKPAVFQLAPLIDIRYMHAPSEAKGYKISAEKNRLKVAKNNYELIFLSDTLKLDNLSIAPQEWVYKLGSGFRKPENNRIIFEKERREIAFLEGLVLKSDTDGKACLYILTNADKICEYQPESVEKLDFLRNYYWLLEKELGRFYADAFLARAYCFLNNFKIAFDNLIAPDAGFGWFRELWLRDVFESLYNNFELCYAYNPSQIKEIIGLCLKYQDKNGLIPTRLTPEPIYNSIDTTLLCFLVAFKYLGKREDANLRNLVVEKAGNFVRGLKNNFSLSDQGLILSSPDAGWLDSKISGISTRLPKGFSENKKYYLIEINAMWLEFLRELCILEQKCMFEKRKYSDFLEYQKLLRDASASFRSVFLHNGILCNIVSEDWKRDTTASSLGIVALNFVRDLFSYEELQKIFSAVNGLLVYRKKKLFGLILRNLPERTYLNDAQYHGAVFWPRDLPYLIKVLLVLKRRDLVKEILVNVLEHQMNEGAIFYTQELFSLPEGNPGYWTDEPVPVKNPAQYWSQFVEPFIWLLEK